MKAQHTPGPWRYDTDSNGWEFRISQEDGAPYTPGYSDVAHFNSVQGEARDIQEANARLIAAAPELLEALEDMVRIFDRSLPSECIGRRTCDNAINAIAKAKGEA